MLDCRVTGTGEAITIFPATGFPGRSNVCVPNLACFTPPHAFVVLSFSEPGSLLLALQGFAAEIVVGELGNVTCFIAPTEERP